MRFKIEQAFKYPFKDEKWLVKVLLLGVMMVIPGIALITVIFALGYLLRLLKGSVAEFNGGAEAKLSDWGDLGKLFQEGLIPWVIAIAYAVAYVFLAFIAGIVFSTFFWFIICVLLGFVLAPVLFVAIVKYSETSKIENAFKFIDIFNELKSKWLDYLVASLVSCVVGSAGFALCFIPGVFTCPYGYIIGVRMFSEIYASKGAYSSAGAEKKE